MSFSQPRWRKTLSLKLESHLTNMHRLYRLLSDELNYQMTDELTIDVVLQLLPPSYNEYVDGYMMAGYDLTFHECLMQIRTLKVELIVG
jgi:hypothetical protein